MAGKHLKLTDYLGRHPTENASIDKNYEKQYVIKNLMEFFKLNYKHGQRMNMNQNFNRVTLQRTWFQRQTEN